MATGQRTTLSFSYDHPEVGAIFVGQVHSMSGRAGALLFADAKTLHLHYVSPTDVMFHSLDGLVLVPLVFEPLVRPVDQGKTETCAAHSILHCLKQTALSAATAGLSIGPDLDYSRLFRELKRRLHAEVGKDWKQQNEAIITSLEEHGLACRTQPGGIHSANDLSAHLRTGGTALISYTSGAKTVSMVSTIHGADGFYQSREMDVAMLPDIWGGVPHIVFCSKVVVADDGSLAFVVLDSAGGTISLWRETEIPKGVNTGRGFYYFVGGRPRPE